MDKRCEDRGEEDRKRERDLPRPVSSPQPGRAGQRDKENKPLKATALSELQSKYT